MKSDGLTGQRMSAARNDAHLSQRALAARLGVSLRTLQNYEAGKFVPYRHLDTLARLLGRSPSWLLCGEGDHDAEQLLARSREQRRQLAQNVKRLAEMRELLADSARQVERTERP